MNSLLKDVGLVVIILVGVTMIIALITTPSPSNFFLLKQVQL